MNYKKTKQKIKDRTANVTACITALTQNTHLIKLKAVMASC